MDREIPPDVADTFQTALGLDEPPKTIGEWVAATTQLLDDVGITVGLEDMCTTDTSRHEARFDNEVRHFHCVLDTLLVPFVLDEPTTVDIRSRSPVSDTIIELSVTREDVSVDPESAVMSFGVAADVGPPDDLEASPALAYERFCPYINAFIDEGEYDEWAAATLDAVTMSLPLTEGFALAQTLTDCSANVSSD